MQRGGIKFSLLLAACCLLAAQSTVVIAQDIAVWNPSTQQDVQTDWLVKPVIAKAQVFKSADGKDLIIWNGLVKRVFRIKPNLACTDYTNLYTGRQLLRNVREEARLTVNGKAYNIGGLKGQTENAYLLPEWVDNFTRGDGDFAFVSYSIKPITPQLKYKARFWSMRPHYGTGKTISFLFKPTARELAGLDVSVNYEIYDGLPLIVKSLTLINHGDKTFKLNRVVNEVLGLVEEDSAVDGTFASMKEPKGIYFETNYAFNGAMRYEQSDQATHWKSDTTYTSQVNYGMHSPVLMENYEDKGPGIELQPGETFNSVRTHELLMNSYDREARGMAVRKMYSAVAPWTLENPIFMHLVSKNDEQVRTAIDQCAATGYEAVILSFGSHLNVEDTTEANIKRWKVLADLPTANT